MSWIDERFQYSLEPRIYSVTALHIEFPFFSLFFLSFFLATLTYLVIRTSEHTPGAIKLKEAKERSSAPSFQNSRTGLILVLAAFMIARSCRLFPFHRSVYFFV